MGIRTTGEAAAGYAGLATKPAGPCIMYACMPLIYAFIACTTGTYLPAGITDPKTVADCLAGPRTAFDFFVRPAAASKV